MTSSGADRSPPQSPSDGGAHGSSGPAAANAAMALLVVRMGGRSCALRAEHVIEILPRVRLSQVPNLPDQVLGVVNVRGRVVPVIDVRARVSGSDAPPPSYLHLVIVLAAGRHVGLAVDEVLDVRDVPRAAVETPGALAGGRGPGVVRIDEDLVLVIAPEDVVHGSL